MIIRKKETLEQGSLDPIPLKRTVVIYFLGIPIYTLLFENKG